MKKTSVTIDFAGKELTLTTGDLAPQATTSIHARLGDTVVLVTVVAGHERTDIDWFPLSVEYQERLYAGGIIKGSRWVKREGRPSDEAVLIGRVIDRTIRPLFPKEYKKEVQIIISVLSVDGEHEPDILALNAVSAALAISPIPWKGPIGGIRMGVVTDPESGKPAYIFNPTTEELKLSELDIVISQSRDLTVMIEAGGSQVPEDKVHGAIVQAHKETQKMIDLIEDLVEKVGLPKVTVTQNPLYLEAVKIIESSYKKEVEGLIQVRVGKEGGGTETDDLLKVILDEHKIKNPDTKIDNKVLNKALEAVMFGIIRRNTVEKKARVDGRKLDEIREIGIKTGLLPRTHGSVLFNRGITQALSIVTLGSPRMEQTIESAEGEEKKRYMHHYSGPPYSFGQTGRFGFLSRREIGHGALAERALEAVLPNKETFPYTIRVVSEVLSQNGSSSMASTCGSTLALMDAGVPISKPVAGISIGMMSLEKKYILLTDIIGLEDFSGDMDFKVAGTDSGITAIQLDVKIPGLTDDQVKEILEQARLARLQILKKMKAALPEPRAQLSAYAPRIVVIKIPVDKIGLVIGPGGKMIKSIRTQTGAEVDIEEDGSVTITGVDDESMQKATELIEGLTREVTVGEVFEGPVKRMLPFGAFVEILPGKEGMVHVSKMKEGFVKSPEDVVQLDQTVKVHVDEIDDQGRINLSMLFGQDGEPVKSTPQAPRQERSFGFSHDRRGGFGGDNNRGSGRPNRKRNY